MIAQLGSAWDNFIVPMLRRPKRLQVAALCFRSDDKGTGKSVLLVTSRDTGRWVLPKGWPIRGLKSSESALREAWEEAGVRQGSVATTPLDTYSYDKRLDSGLAVPVEVLVYPVEVEDMQDSFPEAHERTRKWVAPDQAAKLVQEPQLQAILKGF